MGAARFVRAIGLYCKKLGQSQLGPKLNSYRRASRLQLEWYRRHVLESGILIALIAHRSPFEAVNSEIGASIFDVEQDIQLSLAVLWVFA